MRVRLVCMTVGVAIRGGGGSRAKLFLQFEERLEYFLIVMEIVVHDVDKHASSKMPEMSLRDGEPAS